MLHIDVPNAVVTVLAYFHIISAISWFGAAILFVSTVFPAARKMSRPAFLEFLSTVTSKMKFYFLLAATSTIVFGLALLLTIPDYSPYIFVGVGTAGATYILILSEVPLFTRLSRRAGEILKEGQASAPLPADFLKDAKRGAITTALTVALLATTLVFMVYSGFAA